MPLNCMHRLHLFKHIHKLYICYILLNWMLNSYIQWTISSMNCLPSTFMLFPSLCMIYFLYVSYYIASFNTLTNCSCGTAEVPLHAWEQSPKKVACTLCYNTPIDQLLVAVHLNMLIALFSKSLVFKIANHSSSVVN